MSVEYGKIDASNGVEIDAPIEVDPIASITPSNVFLGLWWRRAKKDAIYFGEFSDLAETWLKIREMEAAQPKEDGILRAAADPDYKQLYFDLVDSLLEEDVHPVEEVQIDQHTFVSESDAEAEIAAMRDEPEKKQKSAAKSAAGKSSFARRKQAALEAVKSARASGCTLQGIADQSNLSLAMVMDLINGVSRPVTYWTKLEKGLKKLGHPPRVIPKEEPHEQEQEE